MTTGWSRSTISRGTKAALTHWFHEADDESACGNSTRRVCVGHDVWPPTQNVCPTCLSLWVAWRGIDGPTKQPEAE
jgi:hypothetical protein